MAMSAGAAPRRHLLAAADGRDRIAHRRCGNYHRRQRQDIYAFQCRELVSDYHSARPSQPERSDEPGLTSRHKAGVRI